MNSFNHYSLGAVGAWLYSHVLGIRPGIHGGYESFIYEPHVSTLDLVRGWLDTPYGRIESAWSIKNRNAALSLTVPEGTRCEVRLPKCTVNGKPYIRGSLLPAGTYEILIV